MRRYLFFVLLLCALPLGVGCGPYTPKQKPLFAQVDQLRSEGFNWSEIAKAINDQGITTLRRKQWTGAHAHSLLKKVKARRLRWLCVA
jgi:DNA-binding transcriptional MerR regulator